MKPVSASASYMDDVKSECRKHLDRFFSDKRLRDGRLVPKEMLYTEENYRRLVVDDISVAFDLLYEELEEFGADECQNTGKTPWSVRFALEQMQECHRRGIPKCMIPGILRIYVHLCYHREEYRIAN